MVLMSLYYMFTIFKILIALKDSKNPSVDLQNLEVYDVSFFVGGNPILKIDKGERPPFPYKMRTLPLIWRRKKKGNMCLLHKRVGGPNGP